jgi:hypothetical protein
VDSVASPDARPEVRLSGKVLFKLSVCFLCYVLICLPHLKQVFEQTFVIYSICLEMPNSSCILNMKHSTLRTVNSPIEVLVDSPLFYVLIQVTDQLK